MSNTAFIGGNLLTNPIMLYYIMRKLNSTGIYEAGVDPKNALTIERLATQQQPTKAVYKKQLNNRPICVGGMEVMDAEAAIATFTPSDANFYRLASHLPGDEFEKEEHAAIAFLLQNNTRSKTQNKTLTTTIAKNSKGKYCFNEPVVISSSGDRAPSASGECALVYTDLAGIGKNAGEKPYINTSLKVFYVGPASTMMWFKGEGKDALFALNDYLTLAQMKVNATYIYNYLYVRSWSKSAIAALLGNMQAESTISHGRWQSGKVGDMDGGFGLVQWTPASDYFNWATENNLEPYDIDTQLARILLEVENEIYQWQSFRTSENETFNKLFGSNYEMSFKEFSKSERSAEELAAVFLLNYERPADKSEEIQRYRGENAKHWYNYFK